MFDVNYSHVEQVTRDVEKHVHEHRAPTDESVALLKEMEEKAQEKLLRSYKLDTNDFNAVWHVMQDNLHMTHRVLIQFELNGKTHDIEYSIDMCASEEEILDKSREKILEYLQGSILRSIKPEQYKVFRGKM
jgi:CRISPR/Cas system-associated endonuclease/helicase Cas3